MYMYYFHFSDQMHVAEDKWSNLKTMMKSTLENKEFTRNS